ncbi:hypothetical protein AALA79_18645 [Lachnospiraceae bacterium 64-25]
MKFLVSRKLATHISIITTTITFAGMLLLWLIVSNRVASMGKNNITSQMISLRIQMIPLFCGRSSNIRKILPHTSQGAIGMQSIKVQMDEIALASSQQSEAPPFPPNCLIGPELRTI